MTKPHDREHERTSVATKQQKLCEQKADVMRRSGTGMERGTHWKSAPGTLDSTEASQLSGNSANAETVAKFIPAICWVRLNPGRRVAFYPRC